MLRYTTDRARPGLVALYDIWPGNGAGHNPGAGTGPSYAETAHTHSDTATRHALHPVYSHLATL